MRKFLKFIFVLLIIIILLVVVPVGALYFLISDSNDQAPTEIYTETITMQGEVDSLFSRFLVNREGSFYLSFSEEELDRLAFAYIRTINPDYYKSGCLSDECKVIASAEIPTDIPIIGGKKVNLRHAYTEIKEDNLNIYITVEAPYLKTKLNLGYKLEKENGTYIFIINKFGLGNLNLMSGFGKRVSKILFDALQITEEKVNQSLQEMELPLTFKLEDFSFRLEKEAIGDLINNFFDQEGTEAKLLTELVNILSSSENNLLDLGFFRYNDKDHFGFRLDLNEIKTDTATANKLSAKRASAAQGFNVSTFIYNKTQTLLIGALSSDTTKISFTNQDFDRIIYNETNGYSGFKFTLVEGNDPNFELTGIFFDFKPDVVCFQFVVEINGIEVLIELTGDIEGNDESDLVIKLRDSMSIGGISASTDFLLDLLGDLDSFSAITFNRTEKTITISANTFQEFMEVGGPETPLSVEKLKAVNGGIEVYVKYTDSELATIIEKAKEDIKEVLGSDFIDESKFDTTEPEQEEIVQELINTLDEISDILNNPETELNSEKTDKLIEVINGLSDENQQILLEQINDFADSLDLENLYEQLFGN